MNPTPLTEADYVRQIDELLSHVWMIRAFLKHCEEAEEDDELRDVQRALYDFMLALGGPLRDGDDAKYLKQAKKKLKKLREADALFQEIQPEISSHTNFQMAAISLRISVKQVGDLIDDYVAQKKVV
jgi:cob(I)alamin adenosyltransferase